MNKYVYKYGELGFTQFKQLFPQIFLHFQNKMS